MNYLFPYGTPHQKSKGSGSTVITLRKRYCTVYKRRRSYLHAATLLILSGPKIGQAATLRRLKLLLVQNTVALQRTELQQLLWQSAR